MQLTQPENTTTWCLLNLSCTRRLYKLTVKFYGGVAGCSRYRHFVVLLSTKYLERVEVNVGPFREVRLESQHVRHRCMLLLLAWLRLQVQMVPA